MGRATKAGGRVLFGAEGGHGINFRRAAGGEPAGEEGDEREERGDGGEGERVVGRDGEKERRKRVGEQERAGEAENESEKGETKTLAEDEAEHIGALGAERHADAEFLGALRNRVGDGAVQTDRGEEKGDSGEKPSEQRGRATGGEAVADARLHRAKIG